MNHGVCYSYIVSGKLKVRICRQVHATFGGFLFLPVFGGLQRVRHETAIEYSLGNFLNMFFCYFMFQHSTIVLIMVVDIFACVCASALLGGGVGLSECVACRMKPYRCA